MRTISPLLFGRCIAGPLDWEQAMFPEITRDEVFRIETKRLWLRWPMFADANDVADQYSNFSTVGSVQLEEAERLIRKWRSATAAGWGLHLLLVHKPTPPRVIGVVQIVASGVGAVLSAFVRPDERGNGFGSEASCAVEEMARWLGVMTLRINEHRIVRPDENGPDRSSAPLPTSGYQGPFVPSP